MPSAIATLIMDSVFFVGVHPLAIPLATFAAIAIHYLRARTR